MAVTTPVEGTRLTSPVDITTNVDGQQEEVDAAVDVDKDVVTGGDTW